MNQLLSEGVEAELVKQLKVVDVKVLIFGVVERSDESAVENDASRATNGRETVQTTGDKLSVDLEHQWLRLQLGHPIFESLHVSSGDVVVGHRLGSAFQGFHRRFFLDHFGDQAPSNLKITQL